MPLTDASIRKLKAKEKEAKYADGGGLCLLVKPTGSKLWRLRYRFSGKQKDLALGAYPEVSLAMAREQRIAAKALLRQGVDPSEDRALKRAKRRELMEDTFARIASELVEKKRKEGLAESTLKKKQWFIDMANTDFGDRPIRELSSASILKTLKKVESKGHYESAQRLRSTIGQVCRFAIATARLENDPTYALRGALISPKVENQPAIVDKEEFEALVRAVWGYDGQPSTNAALKLLVLLYPRPGELRNSRWKEFDLDAAIWTIPAIHEKNRRIHNKPLSAEAVKLLAAHRELTGGGELVFPAQSKPETPLSENTLNQALHRLGYKDRHTSHGFRSSASSLLNESGLWDEDAIEKELSHVERNQSRRPYHRAKYWDDRVRMTEWWSAFVLHAVDAKKTVESA